MWNSEGSTIHNVNKRQKCIYMQIFPNPFLFFLPPFLQVKFNKALADYSIAQSPRLIDGIVLTKFDTIDDKVSVGSFELLACDRQNL